MLRDLDDPPRASDSVYRLDSSDVHVIDWSETIRRSLAKEPIKAHLRCYVGGVGEEDGYWYVTVPHHASGTIGISCVDNADAGGTEMQLSQCGEGLSDGQVYLQVASTARFVAVDGSRAVSLTADKALAAKFNLVVGLGEGLISLELQASSPAPCYLKAVPSEGDVRHGLLCLSRVANGSPLPVQCQFRLAVPVPGRIDDLSPKT
jgi:hypothetical protein